MTYLHLGNKVFSDGDIGYVTFACYFTRKRFTKQGDRELIQKLNCSGLYIKSSRNHASIRHAELHYMVCLSVQQNYS